MGHYIKTAPKNLLFHQKIHTNRCFRSYEGGEPGILSHQHFLKGTVSKRVDFLQCGQGLQQRHLDVRLTLLQKLSFEALGRATFFGTAACATFRRPTLRWLLQFQSLGQNHHWIGGWKVRLFGRKGDDIYTP